MGNHFAAIKMAACFTMKKGDITDSCCHCSSGVAAAAGEGAVRELPVCPGAVGTWEHPRRHLHHHNASSHDRKCLQG